MRHSASYSVTDLIRLALSCFMYQAAGELLKLQVVYEGLNS